MSHASARPETATDRLNQKVFVPSPESSACDTCAVAADIDRMSYFKPTALRNRKLHKHPHRDAAFSTRRRCARQQLPIQYQYRRECRAGRSNVGHHNLSSGFVNGTKGQWAISQVELVPRSRGIDLVRLACGSKDRNQSRLTLAQFLLTENLCNWVISHTYFCLLALSVARLSHLPA